MNTSIKFFVGILLGMLFFDSWVFANESKSLVLAQAVFVTQAQYDRYWEQTPDSATVQNAIFDAIVQPDMRLKNTLDNPQAPIYLTRESQFAYLGPFIIDIEEDINQLYEAFMTPSGSQYERLKSLKSEYGFDMLLPRILTTNLAHARQSEAFWITYPGEKFSSEICRDFMLLGTPDREDHSCHPYQGAFPADHPLEGESFWTLGGESLWEQYPLYRESRFPQTGTVPLLYFTPFSDVDTLEGTIGDAQHDFYHPETGFQWDFVFSDLKTLPTSERTFSDTLRARELPEEDILIYPQWNDSPELSLVGIFGDGMKLGPDTLCTYTRNERRWVTAGYLMQIENLFLANVIFIDEHPDIQFATVDQLKLPETLFVGDVLTVFFIRHWDLMTSWRPELWFTGIDAQFVSQTDSSLSYRILSDGDAQILFHHGGLIQDRMWLRDFPFNITVKYRPAQAPRSLQIISSDSESRTLSWTDSQYGVTYRIYRRTIGSEYNDPLALDLKEKSYTDTEFLPDSIYYYQVTAHNPLGESTPSNEAKLTLSGIEEYFRGHRLVVYPNPVSEYLTFSGTLIAPHRVQIIITDLHGKTRYIRESYGDQAFVSIPVSDWSMGSYFLSIQIENEVFVYPFIKHE